MRQIDSDEYVGFVQWSCPQTTWLGDYAEENGQGWLLCTVTQEGGTAARLGAVLFHGIRGSGLWLAPANPTWVDTGQETISA